MARAAMLLLAALLMPSVAGAADSPLPVVQQAGFLGRWATSCDSPPNPGNPHVIYFDGGNGRVGRQVARGSGPAKLEGRIVAARLLGPGRLALVVRNVNESWQDMDNVMFEIVVEISGDRARTVRSVTNAGSVIIEDGTLADGRPVPTLRRCAEPSRN